MLGKVFPGYRVTNEIALTGLALCFAVGLLAGIVPSWRARELSPVDALRTTA
jgi:ABC-type antimicrobial peptide transport system permease subunit